MEMNARMFSMDLLDYIVPFLSDLGVWTYLLAFVAALTESLAFVGLFIPGTAIVMLAGFTAAQGVVHPVGIMFCIAFGASIGDGFSYFLGAKGGKLFFKNENQIFKSSYLDKSKIFFEKHGNKSIFLARFIGPLRPFVPFLAGMSRMNISVFIFWNVLSAILWSICFVIVGYFFGHAFRLIEMWLSRTGVIAVIIIGVGGGLWYIFTKRREVVTFFNKWF